MRRMLLASLIAVFTSMLPFFISAAVGGQLPATSLDLFKEGSAYFGKRDYPHAASYMQQALDREKQKASLPRDVWRVLVDDLAMAYGVPGDLKRAREVLEYGISQDPEFPNFHYTLACDDAESGDLDHTLEELSAAFKYKSNRIAGEQMPDPRSDDSFRKFRNEKRFQSLMASLYPGQITLYWPSRAESSQEPTGVEKNPHLRDGRQDRTSSAPVGQRKPSGKSICFIGLGEFPVSALEGLASYYRQAYGLNVEVPQGVPIAEGAFDNDRQQLVAERLLTGMRQAEPDLAHDPNAVLIGFTTGDMYMLGKRWQFAFGLREESERAAVVSTARMALHYPGESIDQARPEVRLRKMVTKDVGILYYHLPQNSNPRSVLYNQILGIQELDGVGENF